MDNEPHPLLEILSHIQATKNQILPR